MTKDEGRRLKLKEFLTEEFLMDCLGDGLNIQQIANRTKEMNGGTCSYQSVNYWLKQYGLRPDTPNRKMKTGIVPLKVIKAYDLTHDTEPDMEGNFMYYEANKTVNDIVVMLSDLQIGACSTADGYDPMPEETIQRHVDVYCDNLIRMFARRNLLIGTIHLFMLGDIVDGELIYPKQKTIDMGRQLKIAVRVTRQIIEVLRRYCTLVMVHTVAGNHGRITHSHHKASNWDNVVYDTLEIVYENIDDVIVDSTREFVKVSQVGKWRFLYTHGDIINGMITRNKAIAKSNGLHRRLPHDGFLLGHFHTVFLLNYNRLPIIVNGCMYNSELIQNVLAGWESKRQIVFGVSEGNDYPVDWMEMIDVE